jgi:hypothetical protein
MVEFRALNRTVSSDLGPHVLSQQSTAIAICNDFEPPPRCLSGLHRSATAPPADLRQDAAIQRWVNLIARRCRRCGHRSQRQTCSLPRSISRWVGVFSSSKSSVV